MAITYVNGDISTSDNVSTVTGVSWTGLGHTAGDITLGIWALDQAATTVTLDSAFTQTENHVDQNLRAILHQRLPAAMTGSESGTILYSVDVGTLNRMAVAIGIWRGVSAIGTVVRFTEGGTADDVHPVANNLSITPQADNSLIVLVYSERSSTGNTAGTLTPPNGPGGGAATVRKERGTGSSGGTYVCLADFQLGAGTAGVPQAFTQWDATPDTLIASNCDMWLVELKAIGGTNATPSPAVLPAVVAAPQTVASAGATQAPAATPVVVVAPQAIASISDSQAPSAVTAVVALPQATITGNAVVSPATISAVVTAPSSGLNVGAGPSAITAVVAAPQATPAVAGNTTATPAQIVGVVSVPAAVPSGGAVRSPAVLVTTVSAPQATPSVGTSATATPSATSVVVAFPQALRSAGSTVTPARIQTTVSAPAAIPAAGTTPSPGVISSVVAFLQGLIHAGATASPGAIPVTVALPHATGPVMGYVTPTKVVTTVRDYSSAATARDLQPSAVGRSYVSTAIARSPE